MRLKHVPCLSLAVFFSLQFFSTARCQESSTDRSSPPFPIFLSLEKVLDYAIRNNPTLEEARLEALSKYRQSRASWGDFEPTLNLSGGRNGLDRENNTLETLQQNFNPAFSELNNEYSTGVGGKFFTGTGYNFGYNVKRLQNSLTTGKQYQSFLGVTGEQPLLKNFLFGAPVAGLKITRRDYLIATQQYRKQLMQTVMETEAAYWNLALAQELSKLANESLGIAEKMYAESEAKAKAGTSSELDLTQAKAEREQRITLQAQAHQKLLEASMQLTLLLSNPGISGERLIETLDPLSIDQTKEIPDADRALITEQQPDLKMRRDEVEKENIRLSYYKSQRLPELNLKGNYGWSGLGQNKQQSWDKIESSNWPAWSVMLEMKIPLFAGVRERNELAAARLNKQIAEQRLRAVDYELTRSLFSIEQRLRELKKENDAMNSAAECKQLVLEMAISRFEAGKSDMRFVYDSEEDLYETRRQQLESLFRYKQLALQLQYLQGTLLVNKRLEEIDQNKLVTTGDLPSPA